MSFGIKDDSIEVDRVGWGEQQVEVFEGLCKEKALHRVRLFLGNHTLERSVTRVCATVLHKIAEERLSHAQVARILRVVKQVIG